MITTYTIHDFKTRQGRHVLEQINPKMDYELLNRLEPADPKSLTDIHNSKQDYATLATSLGVYASLGAKPAAGLDLPSGKKFTAEEMVNIQAMQPLLTYLAANQELEKVLTAYKTPAEIRRLVSGEIETSFHEPAKLIAQYPYEATAIRLELNKSLPAAAIPVVDTQNGPRLPALNKDQMIVLFEMWEVMDRVQMGTPNLRLVEEPKP